MKGLTCLLPGILIPAVASAAEPHVQDGMVVTAGVEGRSGGFDAISGTEVPFVRDTRFVLENVMTGNAGHS